MADNYLEKKMEDLRRGTSLSSSLGTATRRKGFVQFSFPQRKIILAGIEPELALSIIREFSRPGSKVAFLHQDVETGNRFARNEGVRFLHIADTTAAEIGKAFDETIKAWREIDIIICPPSIASILGMKLESHIRSRHIPASYKCRMILPAGDDEAETLSSILNNPPFHDVSINGIRISGDVRRLDESIAATVARLSLFLSLPANGSISGNIIKIEE